MKTLNDIFDGRHGLCTKQSISLTRTENMVTKEVLKQEAIEWIKTLVQSNNELTIRGFGYLTYENKGKINWIKMFFDIKDEELK